MSRKEKDHWKGSNLKYAKSFDDNIPYFDKYLARYSEDYRNHRRNYIVTYHLWLRNLEIFKRYDEIRDQIAYILTFKDVFSISKEMLPKIYNGLSDFLVNLQKDKLYEDITHSHKYLKYKEIQDQLASLLKETNANKLKQGIKDLDEFLLLHQFNILDAEYDDIEKFFREEINEREIKIEGKEKWRKSLNSYYEFIRKIYKKKKKQNIFNPVPDRDLYPFDIKRMTKDDLDLDTELLNFDSASKILSYLYYADKEFMYYIIVRFLFHTGARVKEIRTLLEENISFKYRFIFNFIKGTAFGQRYGVYPFPAEFIQDIKLYIDEKNALYPNDPYMFPSPTAKDQCITDKTINKHLNKTCKFLGISHIPHSCHYFRDLINRARRKKGVAKLDRIVLLNQTPKETESKHYNKDLKIILELRNLYDKTYPFPKFRPNKDFLKK